MYKYVQLHMLLHKMYRGDAQCVSSAAYTIHMTADAHSAGTLTLRMMHFCFSH